MELLEKLLNYYGLSKSDYEYMSRPLSEVKLIDPNSIKGMDEVVTRIKKAIKDKEKIIIYGDYDCDGVSATSIMVKTFQKLDYEVSYYIPSRYKDGYGLNVKNVIKMKNNGFSLIICVDNGISAFESISKAKELGIDVIVIDHHDVPPQRVEAVGIIHPIVSEISPIIGSGGYMSLFVSGALLGHYDHYLVTIAGLSTISDLMELKGYNRDVVRLAIDNLKRYKYKPLYYLLDNNVINEKAFSLSIAPKINAVGRLMEDTSVNRLVKYLISEDDLEIERLHEWILSINEQRKELTKEVVDNLPKMDNQNGICMLSNMKEGLIGLVANRLMNEYNVPTIIFTEAEEGILKGSIRSKEGFNVVKAFESLNKYLLTGGGHALAGGLSIKKSDFEAFRDDFIKLTETYKIEEVKEETIGISLNEINYKTYELLQSFAPFGMGFKEPLFEVDHLPTRALTFISGGKHLSTKLSINTKLLGFNISESEMKSSPEVDIIGTFNVSEFKGYETLEFRVQKYSK